MYERLYSVGLRSTVIEVCIWWTVCVFTLCTMYERLKVQ